MQGKRMCVSKFLIYFVLSYCVQSEISKGMLTAGPQSGLFCFVCAKKKKICPVKVKTSFYCLTVGGSEGFDGDWDMDPRFILGEK